MEGTETSIDGDPSPGSSPGSPAGNESVQPTGAGHGDRNKPGVLRRRIFIALGVVAAIASAYLLYESFFYVKTDNAQIQADTVMIASKVPGFVTRVNVIENQNVRRDEVLAEIDSRDYENALRQSQGEIASLEATVKDAERNYARAASLFKSGAVSQQQLDSAQTAARELGRRLQAAQAQVDQARLNLANTKIRAPADGTIARKSAEIGMFASTGTPLFGFVNSETRWVVANLKETELASVKIGDLVDIDVDALPSRAYRGVVESISPATGATFTLLPPDNATGNFTKVVQRVPVRIRFERLRPEDVGLLRAGLSVEVKVHVR